MGSRRHEGSAEEKRGPHATTWKRKDERWVESQRRKAGIALHQEDSVFWHDPMKEMLPDPWGS